MSNLALSQEDERRLVRIAERARCERRAAINKARAEKWIGRGIGAWHTLARAWSYRRRTILRTLGAE